MTATLVRAQTHGHGLMSCEDTAAPTLLERVQETYRGGALFSAIHGIGLGAALSVAVLDPLIGTLLVLPVFELGVLFVLPRVPWFRRSIDRRREERERKRKERLRADLLDRVSLEHRAELEHFEAMIELVRRRIDGSGRGHLRLHERLPFDDVLRRYLRLAVMHADCTALMRVVAAEPVADAGHDDLRIAEIVRRRVRQRAANVRAMQQIEDELVAIRETLLLTCERAAQPPDPELGEDALGHFLEELEENSEAMRALIGLRAEAAEAAWQASAQSEHAA